MRVRTIKCRTVSHFARGIKGCEISGALSNERENGPKFSLSETLSDRRRKKASFECRNPKLFSSLIACSSLHLIRKFLLESPEEKKLSLCNVLYGTPAFDVTSIGAKIGWETPLTSHYFGMFVVSFP